MRIIVSSESPSLLNCTVLIVDDTPANLALVTELLDALGLRVETAQDGEECLSRAVAIRPDMILLDVMMPGIDGFEVARRLKALPAMRDTPIIFMTALTDLEEKIRGFQVGGVDYVTKPLQIEEVKARVITHLRLHLAERAERMQRAAAEQRYQRLFEATADGILVAEARTGIVLDANPAMLKLIREEPAAVVGKPLWEIGALQNLCDSSAAYQDMVAHASSVPKEGVLMPRGGRSVDVEITSSPFHAAGAQIFQCNVRDVSERNRLRRGLLDVTDREQLRLAREVHDGLGQELVGLDLLIHGLMSDAGTTRLPAFEECERMKAITRHALETCHLIAHGLSPLSSTGGGLIEALQSLKERLGGPPGPTLDLQIERRASITVSTNACNHVYRIAQEAVANAIKHARASHIEIAVHVDAKMLELRVTDNGCGLSKARPGRKGLGLQTMRDRAENIGATLFIKELPSGGTAMLLQMPQVSRKGPRKR
jgi:PAS domain S-box-containing protein